MIVASVSSHNTGTTQWMDPRLAQLKKATVDECNDDGKGTKFKLPHTARSTYIMYILFLKK